MSHRTSLSPFATLLYLLSALLLFHPFPAVAIENGTAVTDPKKYPFYVTLQYPHLCGGSLISVNPFWVVTAAHCVFNATVPAAPNSNPNYLCMGSNNAAHQVCANIKGIHVHPDYYNAATGKTDTTSDVALLEVEGNTRDNGDKIVPGPNLWSVPLYSTKIINTNLGGVTIGMGYTALNSNRDTILQEISVNVMPTNAMTPTMIETLSPPETGVCHGDSGGPLLLPNNASNFYLAGVTSIILAAYDPLGASIQTCTVQDNLTANAQNMFTSVANFLDWIANVSNINADQLVTPQLQLNNSTNAPEVTTVVTDVQTLVWYSVGPSGTRVMISTTTMKREYLVSATDLAVFDSAAWGDRKWEIGAGWRLGLVTAVAVGIWGIVW